jgi:hypothetical protein
MGETVTYGSPREARAAMRRRYLMRVAALDRPPRGLPLG